MRSYLHLAVLIALGLFVAVAVGSPGCGDKPAPPPAVEDFTAQDLAAGMELAIAGAELGLYLAIEERDFDACMVLCGALTGLRAARDVAPEVEAEVKQPDGKLTFPATEFDGSICAAFLPDPWPPTEPQPDVEALVSRIAASSLGMASILVDSQAPDEGEGCVRSRVAAAVLRSLAEQLPDVLEEALVDADLKLPIAGFEVDYSGCGLEPEPDDDSGA